MRSLNTVLIRKGEDTRHERHRHTREKATQRWRLRPERWGHKQKATWDLRNQQTLGERQGTDSPPGASRGTKPADTVVWDVWSPDCERVNFCCLGPPSRWHFVRAATGHGCGLCTCDYAYVHCRGSRGTGTPLSRWCAGHFQSADRTEAGREWLSALDGSETKTHSPRLTPQGLSRHWPPPVFTSCKDRQEILLHKQGEVLMLLH